MIANLDSYKTLVMRLYATRFAIIFHCASDDSSTLVTTHRSRERCDIYDKCCNLSRSHTQALPLLLGVRCDKKPLWQKPRLRNVIINHANKLSRIRKDAGPEIRGTTLGVSLRLLLYVIKVFYVALFGVSTRHVRVII